MSFTIITAVVLAAASLLLISAFFKLLIFNTIGDPRTAFERFALRRKQRMIVEIDAALKNRETTRAALLITESFFFDAPLSSHGLIERALSHHLELLNRLVLLSDAVSRHLTGLPVLDDLVHTRADLLRASIDIEESKRSLKRKKLSSGRRTPEWAVHEFSKKLLEVHDKLNLNRTALELKLKDTIHSLHEPSADESVTFH